MKRLMLLLILSVAVMSAQPLQVYDATKSATLGKITGKYITPASPMPTIQLTKYHVTYIDTVKKTTTSKDTVLLSGLFWNKVTIRGMASTDSLEWGIGTTIPSTLTRIFGVGEQSTGFMDKTYFTKLFIIAHGATNAIRTYQVIVEGY